MRSELNKLFQIKKRLSEEGKAFFNLFQLQLIRLKTYHHKAQSTSYPSKTPSYFE